MFVNMIDLQIIDCLGLDLHLGLEFSSYFYSIKLIYYILYYILHFIIISKHELILN